MAFLLPKEQGSKMISPVDKWIAQELKAPNSTPQNLLNWQMKALVNQIQYAKEHSVYYKEKLAHVDVSGICEPKDISCIPFTPPEDLRGDPVSFLCVPQSDISRVATLFTSGSTGERKRIYFTENDLQRTVSFFAWGMSTMVKKGDKVGILMSTPTPNGIADLLKKGLSQIGVASIIYGNVKHVPAAIEVASEVDCIVGVPAEINYLCVTDKTPKPKAVLLSADYVPQSVINNIRQAWGSEVYTHYGMTETCFGGGVQCGVKQNYHLRHTDFFPEIVDPVTGVGLPPGQYGEVVLTTLRNQAMPLVRYRTGDRARLVTGPCACGGVFPRLDKVTGRFGHTFVTKMGTELDINKLDEMMFSIPSVRNFQAARSDEKGWLITIDALGDVAANLRFLEVQDLLAEDGLPVHIKFCRVPPFQGISKRRIEVLP